jgi:hypothetical protein
VCGAGEVCGHLFSGMLERASGLGFLLRLRCVLGVEG